MNIALSGEQVKALSNGAKVMAYSDLAVIGDISKLLPKSVILYQTADKNGCMIGHWCALTKVGNGLYFFDSYGKFVDDTQKFIGGDYLEKTNQIKNKIQKLMRYSNYSNLNYNEHAYQKMSPQISTCGRYAGLFCRLGMTTDEFYDMMKKNKELMGGTYDSVIVKLTDGLF